ncbi:MAG TPA: Holliday junction branch migration protein RuvA [Saprospiraceae bacterium]|nr:Holliday junction branch migration protein RuvA [Saprospiraceae bacterium]
MIGYIKGRITLRSPNFVYLETGGIGYQIFINLQTYSKLENLEEVKLFTYMHVREDSHTLFGFLEEEEKSLFTALISVSGIGTNTARLIMSSMTHEEVRLSILQDQVLSFSAIKGIGPKTAKRIILDLKDKMAKGISDSHVSVQGVDHSWQEEAVSALVALGFPRQVVLKAISQIVQSGHNISSLEDLIKKVLKQLS